MESRIVTQLATLGHPHRLDIFRLLVRRYPDLLPAGEIAEVLGLKASTLSAYLSALKQAGLIVAERRGTSLRYAVEIGAARTMMDDLFLDCCRGRPDLCGPLPFLQPEPRPMSETTYSVLFICTGNSARSIFAETLLRDMAGDRFTVHSAGTRPQSELNPYAVALLREKGHDVTGLRAKNVAEFQGPDAPALDFVFTVCDRAASEECPPWPGQPVSGHWGVADPVKAEGTEAEMALAFQHAYGQLKNRIRAFAALPVASLDRSSLQKAVDDIARDAEEKA